MSLGYLPSARCVREDLIRTPNRPTKASTKENVEMANGQYSVQVNMPAESGEMGVLANHVPSIEQLKPGLIEVIEEQGSSHQFFSTSIEGTETRQRLRNYI